MSKKIKIHAETFTLDASGALYWEERGLLIISDVHLGKIAHFRKYGSALPQEAMQGNFAKLTKVVQSYGPSKICFLGDLFHSAINQEWRLFEAWREQQVADILLVEGNHDIISPLRYDELGVEVLPEYTDKDFLFTHHPDTRPDLFNFAGHLHPGIKLLGWGRQSLKLPCFYRRKTQMILPAFGEFTGNFIITPGPGDKVYALAGEKIIEV